MGVLSGWLSRNEVRKELGENPGPAHLDVFMVPVNMQNSELLLDTEPTLDQALNTPALPAPADDDAPTLQERQALRQYRSAYLRLYRDAVERICKREGEKRDLQAVQTVFQPLLESLSDIADSEARAFVGSDDPVFEPEKTIQTYLKSLQERAKQWLPGDADAISAAELTRSYRAMTYAAHRAAGEHHATRLLEDSNAK